MSKSSQLSAPASSVVHAGIPPATREEAAAQTESSFMQALAAPSYDGRRMLDGKDPPEDYITFVKMAGINMGVASLLLAPNVAGQVSDRNVAVALKLNSALLMQQMLLVGSRIIKEVLDEAGEIYSQGSEFDLCTKKGFLNFYHSGEHLERAHNRLTAYWNVHIPGDPFRRISSHANFARPTAVLTIALLATSFSPVWPEVRLQAILGSAA